MDGHSRMGARLRTEASAFYIASRCAQTYSPLPTGTILPFSKPDQLVCDLEPDRTAEPEQAIVPGQPLLALHDSTGVDKLLESELYAQDLETVVPRLWIITTFSSANINSLHRQQVGPRDSCHRRLPVAPGLAPQSCLQQSHPEMAPLT
jgi:hypothetical protein